MYIYSSVPFQKIPLPFDYRLIFYFRLDLKRLPKIQNPWHRIVFGQLLFRCSRSFLSWNPTDPLCRLEKSAIGPCPQADQSMSHLENLYRNINFARKAPHFLV